jgi:dTDP-4-amino-4,6-dideoxygalactose transaminase
VDRIYLSPPDVGELERQSVLSAIESGWIAPLGPSVDAFEDEFARVLGVPAAVALSSGTAALHLALLVLGVQPGDRVVVPTMTFVATANAVRYTGAEPLFVDSDTVSWTLDVSLLEEVLVDRARHDRLPAAVIGVDLYGQCADWARITDTCTRFGVPTIEDAAEALGASCSGRPAGTLGDIGTFSFNGNKVMTTSGGGMLTAARHDWVQHALRLATQARDPFPYHEHSELGFNYRLSNLLAALGLAQFGRLPEMVRRRRAINAHYRAALRETPGIDFMPLAPYGEPSCWLSVVTIDPSEFGASSADLSERLASQNIEARPTWKPMHLQPLYAGCEVRGGAISERVFRTGLCLPSGSSMTDADVERVVDALLDARERVRPGQATADVPPQRARQIRRKASGVRQRP